MNPIKQFSDKSLVRIILDKIHAIQPEPLRIMEVCGGHTMAIRRYGIQKLLPAGITLLSGPGCPVCVTPTGIIDQAVAYCKLPGIILVTYGDLMRVPGSFSSLEREKALGADVRPVYSTLQALEIARSNYDKKIIFVAIGFETTTPATAIAIQECLESGIKNFFILSAHKTMPQAMAALINEGVNIDGYLGPGHVSAITGSKEFKPLAEKYKMPIVISGFEPLDLVESIYRLVLMIKERRSGVEIQYSRLVSESGNKKAQVLTETFFKPCTSDWRGIGWIDNSGLTLKQEFENFDVVGSIPCEYKSGREPSGCLCGSILKGIKIPTDCLLFGNRCTPVNPVGACMVSAEGACHSYYHFKETDL